MEGKWPLVRGSPRNSGTTSDPGPNEEPTLEWQHDAESRVFGTPIVDSDRVYVATTAQLHHSIDPLVAIDRASGDRCWMAAPDAMEVRGTPAIHGGRVFLGDLDGRLFVLDADGTTIEADTEHDLAPADGVYPIVRDGLVFTQVYQLEARNAETFDRRWRLSDDIIVEEPVAVGDDALVVGCCTSNGSEPVYVGQDEADMPSFVHPLSAAVRSLDVETGTTVWEVAIDGIPQAPAIVDGTVYVAAAGSDPLGTRTSRVVTGVDEQPIPDDEPTEYHSFGFVYALDEETGTERWVTKLSDRVRTMPAVDERYVCVGTVGGELVTLDAKSGEVVWKRRVNEDCSGRSSPTIAGDTVYVGSNDEAVLAFALEDGTERWRFDTEASVDANPAVVGDRLYIADNDGNVYALS